MNWLKQAVAAGYKDVGHMKQDKDLGVCGRRVMTTALRFLVDVGVGTSVEQWLVQAGYDASTVRGIDPHAATMSF